ncbi:MAG: LysM peptidoglycan-binding domain-containing M23 family metallopeptidase [Cyanobacteria bacterium P01_F01_bin.56]
MSPVFSQEFAPDTQSQTDALLLMQSEAGVFETGKRVRTSFTVLSLAISIGAAGSLVSAANAADSMQLAVLPSVSGHADTLPSFGSARPEAALATYHTVVDGETIWAIAKQHGLTVSDIRLANGMGDNQVIQVGQVLKVPAPVATAQPLLNSSEFSVPDEAAAIEDVDQAGDSSELQMAALPEVVVPEQLREVTSDELQKDFPQAAVVDEPLVEAAIDDGVSASEEVSGSAQGNPSIKFSLPNSTLWNDEMPLALLPESEPQVESVQRFAEQLGAHGTAEPVETVTRNLEPSFQSPADDVVHRVRSGETIWSIARSYGLEPDHLQQINRIVNSRMLMPGDELVIPADESLAVPSDEVGRLRRQLMAEQQMAAASSLVEAAATSSEAVDQESESLPTGDIAPAAAVDEARDQAVIADPFVESLLSQVDSVTDSLVRSDAVASAQVSAASADGLAATGEQRQEIASALADSTSEQAVALNPQFTDGAGSELTTVESTLDSENLLAAAPLGSEVYAPIVENPTGRVVAPEMPLLPGQEAYLPEASNHFDGYMWPSQGVLTSGYGWRWGRMHRGVDIAGPVGTPIYAAAAGVVVTSGWNSGGYGNMVDIRHPDGSMTRYAHNSRLLVSPGQQVRQGQQIAAMGSTGYSTGPHLHFEIHVPNQGAVNPMAMLPNR